MVLTLTMRKLWKQSSPKTTSPPRARTRRSMKKMALNLSQSIQVSRIWKASLEKKGNQKQANCTNIFLSIFPAVDRLEERYVDQF